jgi:putative hydrolase of the HAD superfamily
MKKVRPDPMKTRAIMFDFGGTLDSDGVHWSEQFYNEYRDLGCAVSRERFDQAFLEADRIIASSYDVRGHSMKELLDLQVSLQFESLRFEDEDRKRKIVNGCYGSAKKMLDRNREILSRLHGSYRLGVISNFNGNLEVVCREFDIESLLDLILDSGDLEVSKPDPRIFELALERLKLNPSDCCYVGDSFERDIIPAKNVGLRTIWLRGANGRTCPDPSKVDYIISTLPEIEHIFLEKGVH